MDGEEFILFQAMVPGDGKMRNAWLILRKIKNAISEIFYDVPPPLDTESIGNDLLGINSAIVGCFLYTVGGQVPNDFELSNYIRWLDINSRQWDNGTLPSSCADSVIGVYEDYLFILPGVWKYGCYGVDKDTYLSSRPGYIWNTRENKCLETRIGPPKVEGEKWQWRRIRACAPLVGEGLLIAMDGEKNNFFLYNPENNDWKIYNIEDPLPKFIGETSFAASKGRLYILEVQGKSTAFIYIYDIKERKKLVLDKKYDKWLLDLDEWDKEVRLVPLADDKLCCLWLGPVSYENENMWPPVRNLHYVKFYIGSNPTVEVLHKKVFPTNISNLFDCLPCDPKQFGAEVKGKSPLYLTLDAFQKQKEGNVSAEAIGTSFQCVDQLLKQSPSKMNLRNYEVEATSGKGSVVSSKGQSIIKYEDHLLAIDLQGQHFRSGTRTLFSNNVSGSCVIVGQGSVSIKLQAESRGINTDPGARSGSPGVGAFSLGGINFTSGDVSIEYQEERQT